MHRHNISAKTNGAAASTPIPEHLSDLTKRGKKRGNYNCGKCGLPKKGHICSTTPTINTATTATPNISTSVTSSLSVARGGGGPGEPLPSRGGSNLRRALSFDDEVSCASSDGGCCGDVEVEDEVDLEVEENTGGFPVRCLWEVMSRLPPAGLMVGARVCRGWKDLIGKVWKAVEELRLRVPKGMQVGVVGSVLRKCAGLLRLHLWMESDVDATMLAFISFSCPNLESLEISLADGAINRINGDELGRFVAERRCLTTLKIEGCSSLGGFVLCSSNLLTLWLSDLCSLSNMVLNCPNLKEVSLEFSRQEYDNTDLPTMADNLGRHCPRLQSIHISSVRLSHAVVLALTAANLRGLKMLSLVLGSGITDASVAAISSSYSKLELLDLSGSSITDSGIGMICNVFPGTLTRLLLALCPNITSSGIQFATAQLPHLEVMDCGMTICDPNSENATYDDSADSKLQTTSNSKLHFICQKLIIKHNRLKKLSLWGCSALDALCLNCPGLSDLNLNSCNSLHPEKLLLQCPNLESVHASGCQEFLIEAIESQVNNDISDVESHFPCKRLADGSKRVLVPQFLYQQPSYDMKQGKVKRRPCHVLS